MKQLPLISLASTQKEDVHEVIAELTAAPCTNCRLSLLWPANKGLVYRGNPEAKIAVIGEAPGDTEMAQGIPLCGKSGQEWEKWAAYVGINTQRDVFISNVAQCQPPRVKRDGQMQQRPPDKDEIRACWSSRALRVLRAMPNLEVVITLGWVAAEGLLGEWPDGSGPKAKTHEGVWFRTSTLPNVAVYCLVHPSYLLREPNPAKNETVRRCLNQLRREYLETGKVRNLLLEEKVAP